MTLARPVPVDSQTIHRSVLLEEAVSALVTEPGGRYVDATFGRGGHSRAVLARLAPTGRLIGLDRDPEAIAAARALDDPRFRILHSAFGGIGAALAEAGETEPLNGILLDLGVSSPQLDTAERGFSFSADGPLDMRMDPSRGESAADWLMRAEQQEIARVLREFGEERFAKRIARAICERRAEAPLRTTAELAALVDRAQPGRREPGKHPATRTFQALRIQVNDELGEIERCLDQVCELLAPGGRLVVISFHSLEDRIVKHFMRRESRGAVLPKGVPVTGAPAPGRLRLLGKAQRPSAIESGSNPRARSAIMRVAERSPADGAC
ncbi:16S rRNA (cytosine(1402)-N(4))-methyltransferase RsmH [Marichromatium gracile]|uniref:Ribosomal RNA small subunit methyltransferase H n=1 Tax=Marichromatium gracile TaxID=1048 RepID=A0ABR5VD59_MARGR|nr:16S rRNA (cytosine(1402)-N(4))-methyltransferase RsmH [Marichromatium gracile]KXX63628.1 ribosomal RNA small subunit methyltransferase H [Marichromatium gracile]